MGIKVAHKSSCIIAYSFSLVWQYRAYLLYNWSFAVSCLDSLFNSSLFVSVYAVIILVPTRIMRMDNFSRGLMSTIYAGRIHLFTFYVWVTSLLIAALGD